MIVFITLLERFGIKGTDILSVLSWIQRINDTPIFIRFQRIMVRVVYDRVLFTIGNKRGYFI